MKHSENVIVIGAGINGLWATYSLCKEGVKPLLLEQFALPHTRGSSHGQSRIIRYAYEEPHHTAMMPESFRCWKELEAVSGNNIFEKSGLITVFENPTTDSERINAVLENLKAVDISCKVLNAQEMRTRFPGLHVSNGSTGIYETEAGILKADKCCQTLQEEIVKNDGRILDECAVHDIIPVNENRVVIKTSRGEMICKSLIITCGPWAGKVIAKIGMHLPLTPTRIQVSYWRNQHSPNLYSTKRGFPATIFMNETHVYSTPTIEYDGLMKVCFHDGIPCDPDFRDEFDEAQKELLVKQEKKVRDSVVQNFVYLDSNPSLKEYCIYTLTPDHENIVDRHPKFNNIAFAAGFSGSGFKTAPVIGKCLANMVLSKETPSYLKKMSMDRFTNSKL